MVADITRFKEVLSKARSALIILPQNPSIDEAASGLALMLSLRANNVPVSVSCPSHMTVEFSRLVGVDKVREDLGDKNLVISLADYPVENIERVFYDINNDRFELTIISKPGFEAPGQDQLITSYAGVSSDLIIVVGANYPNGLGAFAQNKEILEGPSAGNLTLVGNKPLSGWPKAIELIDVGAVSTSEVVYQVIDQLKLPIDQDIATNLFLGIEAGTKNFTSSGVNASTFAQAAKLLENGARRAQVVEQSFRPIQHPKQVSQPGNQQSLGSRDTTIM